MWENWTLPAIMCDGQFIPRGFFFFFFASRHGNNTKSRPLPFGRSTLRDHPEMNIVLETKANSQSARQTQSRGGEGCSGLVWATEDGVTGTGRWSRVPIKFKMETLVPVSWASSFCFFHTGGRELSKISCQHSTRVVLSV